MTFVVLLNLKIDGNQTVLAISQNTFSFVPQDKESHLEKLEDE